MSKDNNGRPQDEMDDLFEGFRNVDLDFSEDVFYDYLENKRLCTERRNKLRNASTDYFERVSIMNFYDAAMSGRLTDKDKGYIAAFLGNDCRDYVLEGDIFCDEIENKTRFLQDGIEKMAIIADDIFTAEYAVPALCRIIEHRDQPSGRIAGILASFKESVEKLPRKIYDSTIKTDFIVFGVSIAVILILLFFPPVVNWFAGSGGESFSSIIGFIGAALCFFGGGFGLLFVYIFALFAGYTFFGNGLSQGEFLKWIIIICAGISSLLFGFEGASDLRVKNSSSYIESLEERKELAEDLGKFEDCVLTVKSKLLKMADHEEFRNIITEYYNKIIREIRSMQSRI